MRALIVLLLLAGCASSNPETARCDAEADRDPAVRMLRMKGAGAEMFAQDHADELRVAINDARQACRQGSGAGPRGGVERQKR